MELDRALSCRRDKAKERKRKWSSLEGFRPPSIVYNLTGRVLTISLLLLLHLFIPIFLRDSTKLRTSKMKRNHTSPQQKPNPSKKTKKNPQTQCVDVVKTKPFDQQKETVSEEGPWKNLELILSLQSSELNDKE